jgi:hypothetical protein
MMAASLAAMARAQAAAIHVPCRIDVLESDNRPQQGCSCAIVSRWAAWSWWIPLGIYGLVGFALTLSLAVGMGASPGLWLGFDGACQHSSRRSRADGSGRLAPHAQGLVCRLPTVLKKGDA